MTGNGRVILEFGNFLVRVAELPFDRAFRGQ